MGLAEVQALEYLEQGVLWLLMLFYAAIIATFIILKPSRIAQWFYDRGTDLAQLRLGWLAIGALMVAVSFPPLIGHTTITTLCGFAYGMKGFFISAVGSLVGSALVFVALRLLFSRRLKAWASQNEKWQALESVVRAKGLPLIVLIRVSPFPPWVYSNTLFASIEPVKLWQFLFATIFVFPKLLLHTFIGSRMAALADGDQRSHMDPQTKAINAALIAGGIILAALASYAVYTAVTGHIRHLDGLPADVDERAARAIEDFDEEAPLLSPKSFDGDRPIFLRDEEEEGEER
uniref:Golgi apparatus membrane protein TVP38 n=1 Tax=Schizophyllum commune (strain H4-8 / FGSC 9210) TaxID=578458 RepID=D8PV48_SCHCM